MKLLPLLLFFFISPAIYAENAPDIWKPVAKTVCGQINSAVGFYQKGDIKNARLNAVMAYFKGYDAEIEPAVRITLGGPHVFAIERKFRDFSTKMIPNPDKKQQKIVAAFAAELCQDMYKEAAALNAAKVPRQVFKVD